MYNIYKITNKGCIFVKKRAISTILVALLALSSCAGCGSGTSTSSSSDVPSSQSSLNEGSVVSEVSVESSKAESSEESSKVESEVKSSTESLTKVESSDESSDTESNYEENSTLNQQSKLPTKINNNYLFNLKHGKLMSAIDPNNDGKTLVIKAKIKPSYSNKTTISQNYFNVADIIKNQGANSFETIDYWAVADMTDGSEEKVVSFTLDSYTIQNIYDGNIVDNLIGEYATDLWVHQSLR